MTPLHEGATLDHYRIERLVARSGMASIYKATDLNDGKPVALKIPHPDMEADLQLYDRFQREAEIGKSMDHPGVMKVYHDPKPSRVYMAMEWVDGQLLRQVLHDAEEHKLPQDRAIRITLAILDALEYIHGRGVAHR